MPFLLIKQQHQSTEGKALSVIIIIISGISSAPITKRT